MKKVFLEILQNSQETPVPEPFFNKVVGACNLLKMRLWFSCEFWQVSTNTFFTEFLWTTTSEHSVLLFGVSISNLRFAWWIFALLLNYFDCRLNKKLGSIFLSHRFSNIYLFKVDNRNNRKRCEICSKLAKKTTERHHRLYS